MEDEGEYEDEYVGVIDHVASCPITPELVDQLVALAVDEDDEEAAAEATEAAIGRFGWATDGFDVDEARYRTNEGHLVYGSDCYFIPFSYIYDVGGEVMPTDFWGELPGWSSQKDAGPAAFAAVRDAAVAVFTERLGPPEIDIRTDDAHAWRYAAWRLGGTVIVVGQDMDAFSYSQIEESVVYIGPHPADAPLPEAGKFADFISW